MVITGLNNKDLLGCTFDQIMTIIKASNPPITLRLTKPKKTKLIESQQQQQDKQKNNDNLKKISSNKQTRSRPAIKYGPHREKPKKRDNHNIINFQDIDDLNMNIPQRTDISPLMLASFSAENMPISTVLSSSSDEEDIENNNYYHDGMSSNNWNATKIEEDKILKSSDENDEEEDDDDDDDDDDGMSYVNWNNIRLGKY